MKQLPYRQTWNWCERNRNVYAFDCDIDSYNFCKSMNTIEQGCHGECFECLDFHYPAKREECWNYKRTIQITNKLFFDADIRTFRIINPRSSYMEKIWKSSERNVNNY